ncbi:phage major tail protein 2 [uncultured Mediterranean phage uvMED]|nr:phage major tail protein 2 [uncultured Mediterranean phage uvMED]BAR24593.1 phage major tail protein 2 [uncultured Mediterranean phage uvMED]
MATVLSGTSGALYYKPAGTSGTFKAADVTNASNSIKVGTFLNFKVNDKVSFTTGGGTLPGGLAAGTPVFVLTYTASTGAATFAATAGGAELALSNDGTDGTSAFTIKFTEFQAVANVRSWNFEVTRDEIDVTSIGGTLGQNAPFRTFISGFADGTGSAEVYFTDDDTGISARLIEDVTQRNQAGATFKLYMDAVVSAGTPDDAASRSISMDAVLTSASFSVTPDDAQAISINFRPTAAPTFDFAKS